MTKRLLSYSKDKLYFLIFFIAIIIWVSIHYYNVGIAPLKYITIGASIPLIIGFIFTIIGCYSIYLLESIILLKDKIIIKNVFYQIRKTIYLKDIESYIEIEKSNKYKTWNELTIYTKNYKHSFSSDILHDYSYLKRKLTRGKRHNKAKEIEKEYGISQPILLHKLPIKQVFLQYFRITNHDEVFSCSSDGDIEFAVNGIVFISRYNAP